jgi:uncharacterized protein YbjT (DUF2867 family)
MLDWTEVHMIVITTPTGGIGRQVIDYLLDRGESLRVIARDASRLPAPTRSRVEVVEGSHADGRVLDQAFTGVDAVFWLVPPDPRAASAEAAYVDFTRPAAEAFKRHGVKRVVGVTALGRGTPWAAHAGLVTASHHMDDLITSTGVGYRALAMPSFMDNLLRQVESIKDRGAFSLPMPGDRKLPSVATRDIAAIAATPLSDSSWSGVETVPILGAQDVSYDEMANVMSDVLGTPIRFQEMPGEAFKARLAERGMSEAMAQANLDMWIAKASGLDNAQPRTPQATTPTTFRSWCEDVLKPRIEAPVAA